MKLDSPLRQQLFSGVQQSSLMMIMITLLEIYMFMYMNQTKDKLKTNDNTWR